MHRGQLRFGDTQASVLLDAVRALAAGVVLLDHWRNLFFVDYPGIAAHRALYAPLYLIAAAGHQAVVVFFVLSGYLISASVFRSLERTRWSWRTYAIHRLARLWVVLLPGLLLVFLLDTIGGHLSRIPAHLLYAGAVDNHIGINLAQHAGWRTAIGNAAFLQNIVVPTFGSDGALWSLTNEFWYYVLFPLGLTVFLSSFSKRSRVLSLLLFAFLAVRLPHELVFAFPIWLFGTVLCRLPGVRASRRTVWLASMTYTGLFFAFARIPMLQKPWADEVLGALTATWLWLLLSRATMPAGNSRAVRAARTAAGFSFSMYVVHTPVLVLLGALVLPVTRWQPTPVHLAAGIVLLTVAVVASWLFAACTEAHTERIRKWLEQSAGLQDTRLPDASPPEPVG